LVDERVEDADVRWTTLAMAGLATVALEQAVLEPGGSRLWAVSSTALALLVPTLAACWGLARRKEFLLSGASRPPQGAGSLATILTLEALFALPFATETGRFLLSGRSAMAEFTLLAALRNLGLGLAALSCKPVYARLSAVVSLFLVTVASSVGGEGGMAVLAPVCGFAVAGTLWLMLVYWKGLGPGAAAGPDAWRLPRTGAGLVLGLVALLAAFAALGPSRAATALLGLVPTSGGSDWSDPDARSGVGDGDNEVSASEHPESVGFTESEVYLETDRPSLYDAFNESYGEPFKPKKHEKMIALGQQAVGEQKERPTENLQAGREFSAVRRKPEPRPRRPGERAARALVYVKGPTPLHLPLMSYCGFDGTVWREEPCCSRAFPAQREPQSTWLRLPWCEAPFLAGVLAHQIKIGTLESSAMPVPSHLARFRVGSVNQLDFFAWAQLGIVRMTDRTVPAGTVIETEARTVDPRRLESLWLPARSGDEDDHHLSFHGEYTVSPAVASLAQGWVAGLPEGWCQVEAVIAALRSDYIHDRSATSSPGCSDVVAEFLLSARRGPDYLFASAGTVLLRSLGYPSRVVSGLYAAPGRYDPRTRHTAVTRDDVHFWAEVRLPDGLWVAVEPTPGYELMPPVRSWSEQVTQVLVAVGMWARLHAAELLIASLICGLLLIHRRGILDRVATLAFWLSLESDSRRRVLSALCLVERRAKWAGRPRPPSLTLQRWFEPIVRHESGEPRAALEGLIRLADWANHAPKGLELPARASEFDVQQTCRSAVRAWTLSRFRHPISPQPGKGPTT
jgi:protein-glutamine gamma-glutamyltransferase